MKKIRILNHEQNDAVPNVSTIYSRSAVLIHTSAAMVLTMGTNKIIYFGVSVFGLGQQF